MRHPIAIELATETTAFGVVVPDLPGCFSAGDSLDEAVAGAEEAAAAWIDATLDAGEPVPASSSLAAIHGDPALLDDMVERINITLSQREKTAPATSRAAARSADVSLDRRRRTPQIGSGRLIRQEETDHP